MNFSQGPSGRKVQFVNRACFPKEKTPEFTKMGEVHELFVLPLSLVWFAGATPESKRGRPQRGGTNLGVFVPVWQTGHEDAGVVTGHIGTNTPKFVPPHWGRPRFNPTQTGLCRFGWVWSALILWENCWVSLLGSLLRRACSLGVCKTGWFPKRVVLVDVPGTPNTGVRAQKTERHNQKPERGHIRQNHRFTKPPWQTSALYGPIPVQTRTFKEIWQPLVHMNFRGNSHGPIPCCLVFGKFLKSSPRDWLWSMDCSSQPELFPLDSSRTFDARGSVRMISQCTKQYFGGQFCLVPVLGGIALSLWAC